MVLCGLSVKEAYIYLLFSDHETAPEANEIIHGRTECIDTFTNELLDEICKNTNCYA